MRCLRVLLLGILLWAVGCKPIRSFDIFDTLLGRLHKEPHSIFQLVEEKSGIPGFAQIRIAAEIKSPGTLAVIYKQVAQDLHLSEKEAQDLRDLEFAIELDNIFPIQVNLKQVSDGDILVSDTYYNESELRRILKSVGLQKDVTIYASYAGKSSGAIWPKILKHHKIANHLGDNPISDVKLPESFGIKTTLFTEANYTPIEHDVYTAGQVGLANLQRAIRLMNPHEPDSLSGEIWLEQTQYNVPILLVASLALNEFAVQNNMDRFLFSSRGCVHWFSIFKSLFPNYKSIYFQTSRDIYNKPSQSYLDYVRNIYNDKTIIVDEQGTGNSAYNFFKKYFGGIEPVQIALVRVKTSRPGITYYYGDTGGDNIEKINFATEGRLIGFEKNKPIRLATKYNPEILKPAYDCIEKAASLIPMFKFTHFNQALADYLLHVLGKHLSVLIQLPEFHQELNNL